METNDTKHYICTGACNGVSDTPGVCQDKDCPKFGKPLEQCDCTDSSHTTSEKEPSNE